MALWAHGWHRFDGIAGFGRHRLKEDDGVAGPGTTWDIGIAGSRTVRGAHHHGLREGGRCCCGLSNIIVGWGTRHAWLMASPTWVREDGGA
jgi:hypothetical protein